MSDQYVGCCFVFDTWSVDGDHELCWDVAIPRSKTIACGSVASLGCFVTNKPSKKSNTIICPKVSIPGGSFAEQPSRIFKAKSNPPLIWEFLLGRRVPSLQIMCDLPLVAWLSFPTLNKIVVQSIRGLCVYSK